MSYDLALTGGSVVLGDRVVDELNIGVRAGRIVTLTSDALAAERAIDVSGLTVMPGLIDEHFHVFRGYGWETHEGATRAAAKGGITTVVDMPIDKPAILNAELVHEKRNAIANSCFVDYSLFGGYPSGNPEQMTAMVAEGVMAFKLFTGELSPPGMYPGVTDAEVLDTMRRAKALGVTVVVHCENESIVEFETDRLRGEGRTDLEVWDEVRPWFSELEASQRIALLAEVTGCRTVLAHVTHPRVVEVVAAARKRGADIWVETTPHNLLITKEAMARDIRLKWNPPSRPAADASELWAQLERGEVHTIGSDHAPLAKVDGADIWTQVPGAGNSVETMFETVATEAVETHGMSLPRMAEVFATMPARIFGLFPRKGAIAIGSDADFAVVETNGHRKIDATQLEYLDSSQAWSPFDGMAVSIYPVYTILRGNVLFDKGVVAERENRGELITSGRPMAA